MLYRGKSITFGTVCLSLEYPTNKVILKFENVKNHLTYFDLLYFHYILFLNTYFEFLKNFLQ